MDPSIKLQEESDIVLGMENNRDDIETKSPNLITKTDTKWDYIMTFWATTHQQQAEAMQKKLVDAKLTVNQEMSRDGDEIFIYITANDEFIAQGKCIK